MKEFGLLCMTVVHVSFTSSSFRRRESSPFGYLVQSFWLKEEEANCKSLKLLPCWARVGSNDIYLSASGTVEGVDGVKRLSDFYG